MTKNTILKEIHCNKHQGMAKVSGIKILTPSCIVQVNLTLSSIHSKTKDITRECPSCLELDLNLSFHNDIFAEFAQMVKTKAKRTHKTTIVNQ